MRGKRRLVVIGAVAAGTSAAAKANRANPELAAALYAQMTVDDLARLDYSYAPPYAPVWDATLVAASVASRSR